jgi:hypothetical protein
VLIGFQRFSWSFGPGMPLPMPASWRCDTQSREVGPGKGPARPSVRGRDPRCDRPRTMGPLH